MKKKNEVATALFFVRGGSQWCQRKGANPALADLGKMKGHLGTQDSATPGSHIF